MLRAILASSFAVGLLAAGSAGAAEESYTIKFYKSKKGDKSEYESSGTTKNTVSLTGTAKDIDENTVESKKETYREEILEKKAGDKRATKLTRDYSVSEKTAKGATTKNAYAGKSVLIEKKGDLYGFSIAGKSLTKEEAPKLFESFNKSDDDFQNEDFLPKDPVKVGETWKVSAEMMAKFFKKDDGGWLKTDPTQSSITGKLIKAYKKDGAQFGVLELTITVGMSEITLGKSAVKANAGSKMIMKSTTDTCIDGTVGFEASKLSLVMDLAAEIPSGGKFKMLSTTTGTEKNRAVK